MIEREERINKRKGSILGPKVENFSPIIVGTNNSPILLKKIINETDSELKNIPDSATIPKPIYFIYFTFYILFIYFYFI